MVILRSLLIVVGAWWLLASTTAAQSQGLVLKIAADDISTNGTPNGALVRASRAPV